MRMLNKGNQATPVTSYRIEHCANPWKEDCKGTDVVLYILFEGDKLPICGECWNRIADKNFALR